MSVQFGRWNANGAPVDRDYLEKVQPVIAPYGPDHGGSYNKASISILYRAFHTTKESRREIQPHTTESGAVITWDGRLDNRSELVDKLGDLVNADSTDVQIVSRAYEYWREACFSMLIGDWALSIWNPHTRSLILAKDPIGTLHLYYSIERDQVTWSSIVDPLVLFAGHSFALNEEYIAGWLSLFPAPHLTPYVGIHSVPPSSFVLIQKGKHSISKHWDFDPAKKTRYRTDAEYEEHFRSVFTEAVRRRLRSDSPVLAELSGGMDSSSIVCMADTIIARGAAETPRLDTVSYYDDSEPNWNECPYFTKVEEMRGRIGTHIDISKREPLEFALDRFAPTPASSSGRLSETSLQFLACMTSQGNRAVLSGVGGDEVTGGVPTPTPELQDLLARGQVKAFTHQLKVWSLEKRKPWFYLFFEAVRGFFPAAIVGLPKGFRPAAWLTPNFVKRNRSALHGYRTRLKLFGPLPAFQENVSALHALQRQLESYSLSSTPLHEKRYPYLDRNLLEFIYSVPREQLVRPGQRRSLMRRALAHIVPDELLNRRRKAYAARSPIAAIVAEWARYAAVSQGMISASLGILDATALAEAMQFVSRSKEVPGVALMRTLSIELWLRYIRDKELLDRSTPFISRNTSSIWTNRALSEPLQKRSAS